MTFSPAGVGWWPQTGLRVMVDGRLGERREDDVSCARSRASQASVAEPSFESVTVDVGGLAEVDRLGDLGRVGRGGRGRRG